MSDRIPITSAIRRPAPHDVLARDEGTLWEVAFTKRLDAKSASTNVERMTQGELIKLWQQIGVLFNLVGMREAFTEGGAEAFVNPTE
jgi:hypothetical protein